MSTPSSVDFFDTQFQRQVQDESFDLNPFELIALPLLHGRVIDLGCGLGNLAISAARQGCSVCALDASPTAIGRIKRVAEQGALKINATVADLKNYVIPDEFDTAVSIGLLMFFDCATARRQLTRLQDCVKPGGLAVVNVLIEGTTFLDMFDAGGHCLFGKNELPQRFAGWDIQHVEHRDFTVPDGRIKAFCTVVARKPTSGSSTSDR